MPAARRTAAEGELPGAGTFSARRLLRRRDHSADQKRAVIHRKADLKTRKLEAVHPSGFLLISGTGVLRQHGDQALPAVGGNRLEQRRRKVHPQRRCQNLRFPSLLRRSQSLPLRRLLLGRYLRRPMRRLSHPFSVRMNPRSRISHRMTRRKSSLSSPRSLENSNSAVHLRFRTMTKNLNLSKSRDRARSC